MTNDNMLENRDGEIRRIGATYTVRFERHMHHPVEAVWEALTDPYKLSMWLAKVVIELEQDGHVLVEFTNSDSVARGRITELEQHALLEYTWQWKNEPASIVRWELIPTSANDCTLIFTHRNLIGPMPSFIAGWHCHLDLLFDVLHDNVDRFEFSMKKWSALRDEYEAHFSIT